MLKKGWLLRRTSRLVLATVGLLAGTLSAAACRHQGDSVVLAGDGSRLSSEEIDRDPVALLPSGAVGLVHVDAKAALASNMGSSASTLLDRFLPIGPEANFDAQRDVSRVLIGLYSLQGADVAMVVQGNFDPEAIKKSVETGAATKLGMPLTKLSYAKNDIYTTSGLGFVVVTKHTVVAGNETGIRRTLDRIRDKRLKRDVADWMIKLTEQPQASVVAVADLSTDAQVSAAAAQAPFLNGLTTVRILGNFQSPGINLVGSLSYPDEDTAHKAEVSLQELGRLASYAQLLALLGIRPPIQDLQVKSEKKDVQFIAAVDASTIAPFATMAAQMLGSSSSSKPQK